MGTRFFRALSLDAGCRWLCDCGPEAVFTLSADWSALVCGFLFTGVLIIHVTTVTYLDVEHISIVSACRQNTSSVCRIPFVPGGACARAHTRTHSRVVLCARPFLIRVYAHPTPVAAEIILRHTAFFSRADRSSALQRAWQSSRDKERECAYAPVNATRPTFLVS